MSFVPNPVTTTDERTYCAVHPDVETTLRCNRCGRYMCTRCAVRTPVGYRCKQCVHQQQDVYFTATQQDYLIAAAVSFGLGLPAGFIIPRIFLLAVIFLALMAGGFIAEAVHRLTGKRRGRYTWAVVAGGIIAGAVIATVATYGSYLLDAAYLGPGLLLALLPTVVYVVLSVGAAVARLRYGK